MSEVSEHNETPERLIADRLVSSILLVDDRRENLVALEAILQPLGHRLVRAQSGNEALRCVLHEQFAVILLDVEMPGTDGLETARLIKQRTRSEHVPIIFLTALTQDRRQVSLGYESGAVDYLFKPIDPDLLRAKVAAFVELDHLREALADQQGRRFADLAVRESEERFRLVQKATNDVIWDWNLVSDGLRWNELASTVLGMRTDESTNDVRWWVEHIHPDDRVRVETGMRAAIESNDGAAWSAEYRFRLGDGSYRTFLDRAYVVRDHDGAPVRMIGAMQDVTDRVALRESAADAQAHAERARASAESASRLKSEFLATMSHEFRTPLNAIIGYAQLLDMGVLGPATPAQHAHLERLQASAQHLLRLVDDVLDVAKVDADRLDVRHDTLAAGSVVSAAVSLVQPQATAAGIRLHEVGAASTAVTYVGDEHRVRQVLVNLLTNAVKFTPAGGEVTVEAAAVAHADPLVWRAELDRDERAGEHSWTCIRVTDSGSGIPPQLMEQLFEPFTQGDSALTRARGGTGLGLAISRRLARLMGGDVTVRSSADAGSTFTLWLPGEASSVQSPRQEQGQSASRVEPISVTPVLGVAAFAEVVQSELEPAAYDVLRAMGRQLAADAGDVADRYVVALRRDGRFPGAQELPTVQLRDHAAPLIGLLATQLIIIGETSGKAAELLSDGGHMQRVMAEVHGAQRHRLGWTESDIEREIPVLLAEVHRTLHSVTEPMTEASPAALEAATDFALTVSRQMMERAGQTSLRSYRFSRAASTP